MICESKWNSWAILAYNTALVMAVFLITHFFWYGVEDLSAYSRSGKEIVATFSFALAYAYLFNKVTHHWRLDYGYGIIPKQSGGSKLCGNSMTNFFNSLFFAIIIVVIIYTAMTLTGVVISSFYVFILDGIRGAVPPPDAGSGAALVQIGGATIALELFGKTEGTPRRPL